MTHQLLRALLLTLVPYACPCGAPGVHVCDACASACEGEVMRVEEQCSALMRWVGGKRADGGDGRIEAPFPVIAAGEYDGALRELILDFKNGGHYALAPYLASLLDACLAEATRECPREHLVVTAPSKASAYRRRGERPLELLVDELGRHHRVVRGPRLELSGASQHSRNRRERATSTRAITLAAADSRRAWPVRHLIIVDDIATTGATLARIHDALNEHGFEVCAACTLAASRSPSPARADESTLAI